MDNDSDAPGHDHTPDAVPPHRKSPRNTGARTVVVTLGVIAVVAGVWWVLTALL